MPFIPHTDREVREMLDAIGVQSVEDLFDEIPETLKVSLNEAVPSQMNERDITRLMTERATKDGTPLCFIGAGAYDHHIPAAVWQLTTRGEFYTAYTPYQAEASQGTLQLLYEYQTMMASLNAMDVSNASLYDGASALAEAVLMAVRANRKIKTKRILIPSTVHPNYRKTVKTVVSGQQIELVEIGFDVSSGTLDMEQLKAVEGEFAALVIQQPNFFGQMEAIDLLVDWAHENNALAIAVVNPLLASVIKPAGEWGVNGADIAVGEGQPLGIPLSSGGPYYGFICCRQAFVRQMPGRIIGRTIDMDGKEGFSLTLQAREQHIRRSKATSNICTNQGLMVTATTIYMSMMGEEGLQRTATESFQNAHTLLSKLSAVNGVQEKFKGHYFHETVIELKASTELVLKAMAEKNISAGYVLDGDYPELKNCLLICSTEKHAIQDIEQYVLQLDKILSKQN
ncbi:Glycine dehydrogenase [decarboxylating] (glycine cleavage system P1 protein) [hydrothermal vent metagenome]|uniref:glycine dehydrogenase (aminomethyl-transferring) n=1 Tax=hydrothermal vent metagenome TaxID=652676 RepID=A0A3B0YL95_9ZZZZ